MQATARAHPNIALVKYWGKADAGRNLPAVGSISITLDTLATTTTVRFDAALDDDTLVLDGRPAEGRELERVRRALDLVRERVPDAPRAEVSSHNSFPTAAGLASSASGFAALVVAADRALDTGLDRDTVAAIARRGSGSAARSLYDGFVELALGDGATSCRSLLAPEAWPLEVVIAIVSEAAKEIGSTAGMQRTEHTSPYYRAWVDGADADLASARRAITERDFDALARVAEHSCLKMHAVALAADPGLVYWRGPTVDCVHRVRELRRDGVGVFFTIDAGPQVKAVCRPGEGPVVADALRAMPGVGEVLTCGLGSGAQVIG